MTRGLSTEELATAARETARALDGAPLVVVPKCSRCRGRLHASVRQRGTCDGCASGGIRAARVAANLEQIPPVYSGATLGRPPDFLVKDAIRSAAAWLEGSKRVLSIFGAAKAGSSSTAAGKSTLAACVAASAAEGGSSIRWVHAVDLVDPDASIARAAFDSIRYAPFVVLDGCGKEMGHGRNPAFWKSYEADSLRQTMIRAFTTIHQSRGRRFVITYDLDVDTLWQHAYDASIMRRIMNEEFADVITLRRKGELRVTPGGKAE